MGQVDSVASVAWSGGSDASEEFKSTGIACETSGGVEGFATEYRRRRLNFLNISQSSLAEVGYCIHVALRLGYIKENTAAELDLEIRKVGAPLAGLIASERLTINSQTVGVILFVFLLGSRLF